jgi:hypothetical protein
MRNAAVFFFVAVNDLSRYEATERAATKLS